MRRFITLLTAASLLLTACSGNGEDAADTLATTTAPTATTPVSTTSLVPATTQVEVDHTSFLGEPLSAGEVATLEADFAAAVEALVAADNSHNLDAARSVYAEDVIVVDGSTTTGIDALMKVYGNVWAMAANGKVRGGAIYVGQHTDQPISGLALLEQYDQLGYTEDDPMIEYRRMSLDGGLVSSWTSFYDPATRPRFSGADELDAAATTLLDRYAAAWSSGEAAQVAALYTTDASRGDTCLRSAGQGRDAIEDSASGMFDLHPGISWTLTRPLATRRHDKVSAGGVFTIELPGPDGGSCQIEAVVIFEGGDDGIEQEEIFYDADSLIDCGWVS